MISKTERIDLNEIVLFKDIFTGRKVYSIYHAPSDSSIAFDHISQLKEYFNETGNEPYFNNYAIISAYFLAMTDTLALPDDLIFDLECSIVGKGSCYNVSCLSDLIGNDLGYGFLDFNFTEMKDYIAKKINKLLIK